MMAEENTTGEGTQPAQTAAPEPAPHPAPGGPGGGRGRGVYPHAFKIATGLQRLVEFGDQF